MIAAGLASAAGSIGGIGTLISAAGSVISGISAMRQHKFQAAMLRRNAEVARMNAEREQYAGQIDQQERDLSARQTMAVRGAQQAASGFELDSLSFRRRRRADAVLARRDALRIRHEADVRAWNFENQAQTLSAEASLESRAGGFALLSTGLNLGQDLISGATRVNQQRVRMINRQEQVRTLRRTTI